MKTFKFLAFSSILIITFFTIFSCEKIGTTDDDKITFDTASIKFTYKVNGILHDERLHASCVVLVNNSFSFDTWSDNNHISFFINNLTGTGQYIVDKDFTNITDYQTNTFTYNIKNTNVDYGVKDTIAIINITKYDKLNNYIGGTFEAKSLSTWYGEKRISITEGEFYVGTHKLHEFINKK